jgi:hypothetical protein
MDAISVIKTMRSMEWQRVQSSIWAFVETFSHYPLEDYEEDDRREVISAARQFISRVDEMF